MAEREQASPQMPRKVGVREFRGNFSGFMRQVRHGSSFAVTSRDAVIAIIQPPQTPPPRRHPGTLRGKMRMAPDFDIAPPELLAAVEGEPE